jgi:hypothetical protein
LADAATKASDALTFGPGNSPRGITLPADLPNNVKKFLNGLWILDQMSE